MHRTGKFIILFFALSLILAGETAWLHKNRSQSAYDKAGISDFVAVTGVFLPAFYNESPFIRHSIFADDSSIFQHDPMMMDSSFGSIVYGRVYQ